MSVRTNSARGKKSGSSLDRPEPVKATEVTVSAPANENVGTPERVIMATNYCCAAAETNCFCPSECPEFCGQMSSVYAGVCCFRYTSYGCIMPGHQAFEGLSEGRDDVCLVGKQTQCFIVKPQCIDGSRPYFKSAAKMYCCVDKCSAPRDPDVPGRCAAYCINCPCCPMDCCCDKKGDVYKVGCCCPQVAPISEKAFGSFDANYIMMNVQDQKEFLFHAVPGIPCEATTCFIPKSFAQSYGGQSKVICCCVEMEDMNMLLPENEGDEHEETLLRCMSSCKCVKPRTCCKLIQRQGFCINKCAFPCDKDVPFALACCGCKIFACDVNGFNDSYEGCYKGCRTKDYGAQGGSPSTWEFGAPVATIADEDVKETDSVSAQPEMERG